MNADAIKELRNWFAMQTRNYFWAQLRFKKADIQKIVDQIFFVAKDIEKEKPEFSSDLSAIKDHVFTKDKTIDPYYCGVLIQDLTILMREIISDGDWKYIHPKIKRSSRKLYEDGHYANAAVDAFIEINDRVKQLYKKFEPNGKILDGQPLMNRVFSDEKPLLEICDRTVESGTDIHNGLRSMLAGAMSAFRNPKAHANVPLDSAEAMRQLMFASTLMYRIDAAVERAGLTEN